MDANLYPKQLPQTFLSEERTLTTSGDVGCTQMNYYYGICSNPYSEKLDWQMQNIDKARIRGLELTGRLNLDKWFLSYLKAGNCFGSVGYAKSKLSGNNSLLSTQPLKVIAGVDYESPSEKWGVFSRLTYLGAKKSQRCAVHRV